MRVKILITLDGHGLKTCSTLRELNVETESEKRLTATRAARILAHHIPKFRRRKGRYAARQGSEVLPVMEMADGGWRAWRLQTDDDGPSGYEPPLPGRTGRRNSANNPFADRTRGIWECAHVFEEGEVQGSKINSETGDRKE